ncbi:MAG: hypothetical protein ACK5ML_09905 [Lachnospiraceae bacterium]
MKSNHESDSLLERDFAVTREVRFRIHREERMQVIEFRYAMIQCLI